MAHSNGEVLQCFKQEDVVEMISEATLQMAIQPPFCPLEDSFPKPLPSGHHAVKQPNVALAKILRAHTWGCAHREEEEKKRRREGALVIRDSNASWFPDPGVIWLQLYKRSRAKNTQGNYSLNNWSQC